MTVGADVVARSFALPATDGQPYALEDHGGGPLLLGFFKTTCPACLLAFPYLEKLFQTYGEHGLTVWGISQDPLDESLAFAADQGLTFPILLDTGWEVSIQYGVKTVPALFLFDQAHEVIWSGVGFSKDDLNQVARLVATETGRPPAVIAAADDGKPPFKPG